MKIQKLMVLISLVICLMFSSACGSPVKTYMGGYKWGQSRSDVKKYQIKNGRYVTIHGEKLFANLYYDDDKLYKIEYHRSKGDIFYEENNKQAKELFINEWDKYEGELISDLGEPDTKLDTDLVWYKGNDYVRLYIDFEPSISSYIKERHYQAVLKLVICSRIY